ncbi:MAG: sodium-translocating pyrophosphatase [Anaerolineae bacterium]|nr:sodium-translocating pyrophosphatase [Anaerolineae bacterium]
MDWVILTPISAVVSILVGGFLFYRVNNAPTGSEKAAKVSNAIREGANAYLKVLYTALVIVATVLAIVLIFLFGIWTAVAFVLGAMCSALAGYFGMQVALMANAKSATAAEKGLSPAFAVAFSAGGVMGMAVVGLAVLGMGIIYIIFRDPQIVLGFSFGASSLALLAKAGGGIYTKTADIGADLVGKVELTLPEDDPRNPAVIADNVGDNVGDVAGMGGDIFDSYVASVVAVMILGAELHAKNAGIYGLQYVTLPLIFASAGILSSVVGMLFVRTSEGKNPGRGLNMGTYATTAVFIALSLGVISMLKIHMAYFWASTAGLIAGVIIGMTTDYYTSIDQKAVKNTAEASQTGVAINILTGFSYGLLSIVPPILGICAAMIAAYFIAESQGMSGLYGIAVSAVGMLSITGMIVSADAYGPIVDNAQGVAEMSGMSPEVIHVCSQMDAAGNTAKAITKGFAIGAAGLTVLALFAAYSEVVDLTSLDLLNPIVIVGVFLGAMMPPVFSAMLILSVGKNAFKMIEEIRRQVREIPGLLAGTQDPDYASCVRIASQGALWELVAPGLLAFLSPLVVGFVLGKEALGGFLGGSIFVGLIFALLMANSGGLWDNAKKYIEDGALGGPGSEEHKAAVVGDTVGDPFKDTAGPSINTLITVMSLVATIFAPVIVKNNLPTLLGWFK